MKNIKLLSLLVFSFTTLFFGLYSPEKAEAITSRYSNNNYPMTQIPAGNGLRRSRPARCTDDGGTYQNSGQTSWIAVNSGTNFSSTSTTVPYGTRNISLVSVHAVSTCYDSLYLPSATGYRFSNITASGGATVSGIAGQINIVGYPNYSNRDTHVGVIGLPFTLTLPAGLSGGPHTFNVSMNVEKKINDRSKLAGTSSAFGRYQCVKSGEYVGGFSNADFNACSVSSAAVMPITITVAPPLNRPPTITTSITCDTLTYTVNDPDGDFHNVGVWIDTPRNPSNESANHIHGASNRRNGTYTFNISAYRDWASRNFYVMVRDHGNNVLYNAPPYPVVRGPCVSITCPASVQIFKYKSPISSADEPTTPQPNEKFVIRAVANHSGAFGTQGRNRNYTVELLSPSPGSLSGYEEGGQPASSTNPVGKRFAGSLSNTGDYTISYRITGLNPSPRTCTFNNGLEVRNKPFLQAFRGDVIAGATIHDASIGDCTPPGTGKIDAFNNGSGDSFKGAGSQLGVLATGRVNGFISASLRTVAPQPAKGLTFANSGANNGNFGSLSEACTNHFSGATPSAGNVTISSSQAVSSDRIVYIDGDLRINNNITYASASWSNVQDIPAIRYIVKGNIYIHPNATILSGTYVALPRDDGSGGEVYTCAFGFNGPNQEQMANQCATAGALKIYGSLIAKKVFLHRLNGTVNAANPTHDHHNTTAAEVFTESPLNWLAPPPSTGSNQTPPYESITSLPPVL